MRFSDIIIPNQIYLLTAFAVLLSIIRIAVYGSSFLLYMLWNIFLAYLPFIISFVLLWYVDHKKITKGSAAVAGVFWFLLFPNAPYIVTDFIHVGSSRLVPIWLDILLIFTCASVGLLLGFHSLFHIEQLLQKRFSRSRVTVILSGLLAFSSFGIYIGRFLRFNSWDVFTDSTFFLKNVWRIVIGASHFPESYIFSGYFFVFLWVTYTAWKYDKTERGVSSSR